MVWKPYRPPLSSSPTWVKMMSPFSLMPRRLIALKAIVSPQVAILLSQAPLPQIHPSAISAENGGWVQVSRSPAGTVS